MSEIYNDFKEFCEYELRDDENPHLAPTSFNAMPQAGLASMTIPLVGVSSINTRRVDRALKSFRNGEAVLCINEGINGKPEYHVEIPLPRKSHKKGRPHKRSRRHHHVTGKPSCTKLLVLVLLFVTVLFVGFVTQSLPGI